ncbi:hypothetical protein TPAR_04961, partial [Tolypocladium paradoxum]
PARHLPPIPRRRRLTAAPQATQPKHQAHHRGPGLATLALNTSHHHHHHHHHHHKSPSRSIALPPLPRASAARPTAGQDRPTNIVARLRLEQAHSRPRSVLDQHPTANDQDRLVRNSAVLPVHLPNTSIPQSPFPRVFIGNTISRPETAVASTFLHYQVRISPDDCPPGVGLASHILRFVRIPPRAGLSRPSSTHRAGRTHDKVPLLDARRFPARVVNVLQSRDW